jgi:hypothetical protein
MKRASILLALLLLITSACVWSVPRPTPTPPATATSLPLPSETPTAVPTETPTPTPTLAPAATEPPADVVYGPDNFPETVNPLTGQIANDPAILNRRPVSVKVQIFPRGQRPPWGISNADIVFDYYQNTGMTRFHAIYYGNNAEQVGPIRSARLFDEAVVNMYKSILAFGGADRRIMRELVSSSFGDRLVLEGNGNCPPMCRIDPNGANFLVANTAEISNYAAAKGISNERQNLNGLLFNSAVPANGQPGTQISFRFSIAAYNRWDYDPTMGRYLRSQDTVEAATADAEVLAPMVDRATNQQIATDNVIVLFAEHKYAFGTRPGNAEIVNIELIGQGVAAAFRDGQAYQLVWTRADPASIFTLTFPDGTPYALKPGNTWVEVVGKNTTVENPVSGVWRFVSSIP